MNDENAECGMRNLKLETRNLVSMARNLRGERSVSIEGHCAAFVRGLGVRGVVSGWEDGGWEFWNGGFKSGGLAGSCAQGGAGE